MTAPDDNTQDDKRYHRVLCKITLCGLLISGHVLHKHGLLLRLDDNFSLYMSVDQFSPMHHYYRTDPMSMIC